MKLSHLLITTTLLCAVVAMPAAAQANFSEAIAVVMYQLSQRALRAQRLALVSLKQNDRDGSATKSC
jgi:hypothetical protein